MRIHIENDLYVSGDGRGFSIERKTVTQSGENEGKESFITIGHYVSLKSCIEGLLKVKVSESVTGTLQELLAEVKQHRTFLEAQISI